MRSSEIAAVAYLNRGWAPIPVKPRDKAPRSNGGWQALRLNRDSIGEEFASNENVGVLLGEPSGNLVDLDLDSVEARRLAPFLLPPTLQFGRRGAPGSHFLVRTSDRAATTRKFSDPGAKNDERAMLVELRSNGHQTVFPPSVHPSGEVVTWQGDRASTLASMLAEELERVAAHLGAAALLSRHWREGLRQDAALALAGGLLQAQWSLEDVVTLVTAVTKGALDLEPKKRVAAVKRTAAMLEAGAEITGWPRLAELLGENIVASVRSWLGVDEQAVRIAGGKIKATDLVGAAEDAELFHTADREAFLTLTNREHRETHAVKSLHVREWLSAHCYRTFGEPPKQQAITEAIDVLCAKAKFDGPQIVVCARIGHHDGRIYLDLGDECWTTLEVSRTGWRVVESGPVRFRRGRGTRALPMPVEGGDINELRSFLNCPDDRDWKLLLAWMISCFHPTGPYPLLILQGEQGSAKTTSARLLKALIDPTAPALRARPPEDRELLIAARNCHLLGFDNLSGIKSDISDALCRLATGGGIGMRQLYTDADEVLFEARRPVMITGIDSVATRGDLADRSIVITLPSIGEDERRAEGDLVAEFEQARPRLFGALLSALAGVLAIVDGVELRRSPRMADFARWGVALERVMAWAEGSFLSAYEQNRQAGAAAVVESDAVAVGIQRLIEKAPALTGTASDFLRALDEEIEPQLRDWGWPRTPNAMGSRLLRVRPALQKIGIEIAYERTRNTRIITVVKRTVLRAVQAGTREPTSVRALGPIGIGADGDEGDDDDDPPKAGKRTRGFAAVREAAARLDARKRARRTS